MASAGKGGFGSTNMRKKKAAAAVKTANRKTDAARKTAAKAKTRPEGAGKTATRKTATRKTATRPAGA
jgi:hypothetical protein